MLAANLKPAVEERVTFEHFDVRRVPAVSGCYALAAFDGRILYIGQTRDLNQRMRQHLDDKAKRAATPWGVAQRFYFRKCPPAGLSDLESAWVDQFREANGGKLPFFNKVEPPRV